MIAELSSVIQYAWPMCHMILRTESQPKCNGNILCRIENTNQKALVVKPR